MEANVRWNIFARVLEDILTKRHLNWQDLYGRVVIEQDMVDSLQASLISPTAFPILNIEEMDDVIDLFDIDAHEILQLRAAIIATSVEAMLMERIESQAALEAAEQVFTTTLDALVKQGSEKRGDAGLMNDEGPESFFRQVKRSIDAGTSARQLSHSVSKEVRVEQLQVAAHHFEQAMKLLKQGSHLSTTKLWNNYFQRVQKDLAQIRKDLASLGR